MQTTIEQNQVAAASLDSVQAAVIKRKRAKLQWNVHCQVATKCELEASFHGLGKIAGHSDRVLRQNKESPGFHVRCTPPISQDKKTTVSPCQQPLLSFLCCPQN